MLRARERARELASTSGSPKHDSLAVSEPRQAGSAELVEAAAALAWKPRLGTRLADRGLLPREAIANVLALQARWGCRFGEALIALGLVTPQEFAEVLAEDLGVPFADLVADPPDPALCDAADIDLYLRYLFLPWQVVGKSVVVACANPNPALDRLIRQLYGERTRIAVTAKFDIIWTVQRLFNKVLSRDAILHLHRRAPRFSARTTIVDSQLCVLAVAIATLVGMTIAAPRLAVVLLVGFLSFCYVANLIFRVVLFWAGGSWRKAGRQITREELAALDERNMPVFSIIVPLYREANMVEQVAQSLALLDYPPAKLDIKLVLEEDDLATIAAAKALRLDGRYEILRVPPTRPRTKPKACNYALRFVRGTYVVIYDAEDRPEPDQLKKAVAAFHDAPRDVACLQARLNFYNPKDNWLTRMFALEYALWFDFLLPGLERLGVPIPLGGTSNLFRTHILRDVLGWDAFNVTEDADLGMRLAQRGYKVIPIDSSTYEEANPHLGNWLRQRSRWIKGYMQTWLVHLRSPAAFARVVGIAPFAGFVLFIGGAIFTGLVTPFFWALFIIWLWTGSGPFGELFGSASLAVSLASLVISNGLLTVLAILAPMKRRWLSLAPYGITVLAYWLLISLAAYKALWQLITRPFHWEKTEHGLSRPRAPSSQRRRHVGFASPVLVRAALLSLILLAGSATHAWPKPWLPQAGDGEVNLSVIATQSSDSFESVAIPSGVERLSLCLHFEYGVSDNLTLLVDSAFQRFSDGHLSTDPSGLRMDKAMAGARVPLARWGSTIISAEAMAGSDAVYESTPKSIFASTRGAAEARLMLGQSFPLLGGDGFFALEAGGRWRAGPPANEGILDATLGASLTPSWLLLLQSFTTASVDDAQAPYRRYLLSKAQASTAFRLTDGLWLQAGAFGTVAHEDTGEERGGVVSIWWKF